MITLIKLVINIIKEYLRNFPEKIWLGWHQLIQQVKLGLLLNHQGPVFTEGEMCVLPLNYRFVDILVNISC